METRLQDNINYFARPKTLDDICKCGNLARRDGKCWNCVFMHPPNQPISDRARQRILERMRDLPELGSM